jgi:hypothetical protein
LAFLAVAGCGSNPGHNATASSHSGLTEDQFNTAVSIAHDEADRTGATVTSATATVGQGVVTDSNTGHECRSGKLLHIMLVGRFPGIATGGHPVASRALSPSDDGSVHAEEITADPNNRQVCLISVRTGAAVPDAHAAVLFTH